METGVTWDGMVVTKLKKNFIFIHFHVKLLLLQNSLLLFLKPIMIYKAIVYLDFIKFITNVMFGNFSPPKEEV